MRQKNKVNKSETSKVKETSKKEEPQVLPTESELEEVEEEVTRKSQPAKKKGKASKEETTSAEEETSASPEADVEEEKRKVVTRESLLEDGEELVKAVHDEIERLRNGDSKSRGSKFLRSLGKKLKTYNNNVARITKQKPKTKRENNGNAGFLKPVKISPEMREFTGWSETDLKSRVDVTKFICSYIKEHDLQNPSDRRQILPDEKLSKLLGYDSERDGELKYYSLQKHLKQHFNGRE